MVTKTNRALSDVFDVQPTHADIVDYVPIDNSKKSLETDFDVARSTMHNLLLKGQQSLEQAILIANGTEDPESFNAVSTLIGKMTDASIKLIGIHEAKMKVENKIEVKVPPEQHASTMNVNGPVFVGSTSEFAKFLSDKTKVI